LGAIRDFHVEDGTLPEEEPLASDGEDGGGGASLAPAGEPPLEWRRCMDDLGGSNRLCSEALERVMWACPGSAQLLWGHAGPPAGGGGGMRGGGSASRPSFLPFL
jgi:hypothetical protein